MRHPNSRSAPVALVRSFGPFGSGVEQVRLDPALLAVTTQTEVIASVGNRSDVSSAGTRDPSLRRDGAVSRTPI